MTRDRLDSPCRGIHINFGLRTTSHWDPWLHFPLGSPFFFFIFFFFLFLFLFFSSLPFLEQEKERRRAGMSQESRPIFFFCTREKKWRVDFERDYLFKHIFILSSGNVIVIELDRSLNVKRMNSSFIYFFVYSKLEIRIVICICSKWKWSCWIFF